MENRKIIFVLTSHREMSESGRNTGVWLEEFSTPYYAFTDAGVQADIASVQGGSIPIDPGSQRPVGENDESVERFLADDGLVQQLQSSRPIEDIDFADYDALFLPGGHGTMWDLPSSAVLSQAVQDILTRGGIVAAVCHGPAGLVSARTLEGSPVVAGRRVAAFTNAEEDAAGLTDQMPFLLETRLRELGAEYESGPNFQPYAVVDGNLITGQNPASSGEVAQLVLKALSNSESQLAVSQ